MIDQILRKPKEKLFAPIAKSLDKIHPNTLSIIAFVVGLFSVLAILFGFYYLALVLWLSNRILDGLDGEIARAHSKQSDLGGYLDIMLDFIIYAFLPIALVYTNPSTKNYLLLAILLASFYINAGSWMYLSALLEKRGQGIKNSQQKTSIKMPSGLIEGTGTIIFYCLFIVFHKYLNILFLTMSAMVIVTIIQRILWANRNLKE